MGHLNLLLFITIDFVVVIIIKIWSVWWLILLLGNLEIWLLIWFYVLWLLLIITWPFIVGIWLVIIIIWYTVVDIRLRIFNVWLRIFNVWLTINTWLIVDIVDIWLIIVNIWLNSLIRFILKIIAIYLVSTHYISLFLLSIIYGFKLLLLICIILHFMIIIVWDLVDNWSRDIGGWQFSGQ